MGDKQSNRYKAHNETFTRFIHFELLELIEHITNRKLKPTYTYLSAYIKDANLPPHTDREDCEYTVSFIIDKPKNLEWDIYYHKVTQKEKYKGRYEITPDKEECIGLDCNSNGIIMFSGTDHIHFREKLEGDYCNIVLFHYKSV